MCVHFPAAPSESDPDLLAFAAQVEQLEAMLAAHDAAMDAEEEALQHAQDSVLPELREFNQQLQAQQQSVADNVALVAAQSQPTVSRQPLSNKTNTQSASSVGRDSRTHARTCACAHNRERATAGRSPPSSPLPLSAFRISCCGSPLRLLGDRGQNVAAGRRSARKSVIASEPQNRKGGEKGMRLQHICRVSFD